MKSRAELHKNVLKGALGICGFDEAPELQGLIRESIMIGLTGSGSAAGCGAPAAAATENPRRCVFRTNLYATRCVGPSDTAALRGQNAPVRCE